MMFRPVILLGAAVLMQAGVCSAMEQTPAARAKGIEIEWETLEEAARIELEKLALERLRFEAEMKKKRHEILDGKLKELMGQRVLEAEASAQQTTTEELVKQAGAETEAPSPEEVERLYEANKARFKEPKEDVLPRIETFIQQQKSRQAFVQYLEELTRQYEAEYFLEPLRFDVGTAGSPSLGPEDAPVTIIEFSDFQCPYCARVGPTLKRVADEYENKVRLVFRQFPLTNIHAEAQGASEAALCAADQGKFWEMHDSMFADQKSLSPEQLKATAASLGLDTESFNDCLDSHRHTRTVEKDVREGIQVGVSGTPAFFINGRPLSGAQSYEAIKAIIDEELHIREPEEQAHIHSSSAPQ